MLTATVTIASGDAGTVVTSIGPEAGRELPRTSVKVSEEGERAVIRIEATDTSAMRAAINSYLECIRITEDIDRITR